MNMYWTQQYTKSIFFPDESSRTQRAVQQNVVHLTPNRFEVLSQGVEQDGIDEQDECVPTDVKAQYHRHLLLQRVEQDIAKWAHPGSSKRMQLMKHYPGLFPKSLEYKRLFLSHKMPLHALMNERT